MTVLSPYGSLTSRKRSKKIMTGLQEKGFTDVQTGRQTQIDWILTKDGDPITNLQISTNFLNKLANMQTN